MEMFDYLNKKWVKYENRITEMTDEEARTFIPQTVFAMERYIELVYTWHVHPGVACLRVLVDLA